MDELRADLSDEVAVAIRKLRKLSRGKRGVPKLSYRFTLDELDAAGGEGWLAPLRPAPPEAILELLDVVRSGTSLGAVAAAGILFFSFHKQRRTLPLPTLALPMLALFQEMRDTPEAKRRERWLSPKNEVKPRGDSWAWIESHLVAYGARLEPVLLEQALAGVEAGTSPAAFWILADQVTFGKGLAQTTYESFEKLLNDVQQNPRAYDKKSLVGLDEVYRRSDPMDSPRRPPLWHEAAERLAGSEG